MQNLKKQQLLAARQPDDVTDMGGTAPRIREKRPRKDSGAGSGVEDPRRIIRQGLTVIVLFFGVLGLWAVFGEISGAVVAPGKIKIETERKTVQHLEGGIVDAILVREGENVVAGQPLIILESVQIDASVDMLRTHLIGQLAAHARYTAEKDMRDAIVWPEELQTLAVGAHADDILANEQKIFSTRRDALHGQISVLGSQIGQIEAQISGFEEQYRAEQAIIGTLQEELKAKRQLFNERYLEKSQILELERMLATHQGSRGHLRQAMAEARSKRDETRLRIDDAKNRFMEDAAGQLGRLENEILQTREKIRPLRDAKKRLTVAAPVTGRVVGLKVHSRGGVVRPGEPLLDIVPDDTPLIVEVQVPVNKITEVYAGQDAQVQLDAFDTRITPLIKARVVQISADRLEDQASRMPYYLCYVEIDPEALREAQLYLSPGMPATVFITTTEKTVLYYMVEPLIKNWDRALRE